MIAPLKPGVTLPHAIRSRDRDRTPAAAAMARRATWRPIPRCCPIPAPARFITVDGKPVIDEMTGWRNAVVMAGHWVLHGAGMFVVEEKSPANSPDASGRGSRRDGRALKSAGASREFRGKGYAVEAARASIDWAFATFEIDQIVHCIDCENVASQGVARRLGAEKDRKIELFGHVADLWVTSRDGWNGWLTAS